jgi:hypothetical protein
MQGIVLRGIAGVIAAACIVVHAARLGAIETSYGEDPVPDTRCYKGFIDLGYGIDPIPAKTLSERWQEWRAGRGMPPRGRIFYRTQAASTPPTVGKPIDIQPNTRQTANSQSAKRAR